MGKLLRFPERQGRDIETEEDLKELIDEVMENEWKDWRRRWFWKHLLKGIGEGIDE